MEQDKTEKHRIIELVLENVYQESERLRDLDRLLEYDEAYDYAADLLDQMGFNSVDKDWVLSTITFKSPVMPDDLGEDGCLLVSAIIN